jgi:hypothetical protein
VNDPPADILRRLRPIPTSVGPPTAVPRDVRGTGTDGEPCRIRVEGATEPLLLLFLSAGCLGCRDLWEGLAELSSGLAGVSRLAVVTRDPGEEDIGSITALAGDAPGELGVPVVMSSEAFGHYKVAGPPFLVVAAGEAVRTESVAWGVQQTLHTALDALGGAEPS